MLNMNRIVTIFLCSIVVSLFVGCDYVKGISVDNQSNDTLLFCVKGSAADTLPPVQMLDKYDLISPGEEGYYGGMVNGPDDYTMFLMIGQDLQRCSFSEWKHLGNIRITVSGLKTAFWLAMCWIWKH